MMPIYYTEYYIFQLLQSAHSAQVENKLSSIYMIPGNRHLMCHVICDRPLATVDMMRCCQLLVVTEE